MKAAAAGASRKVVTTSRAARCGAGRRAWRQAQPIAISRPDGVAADSAGYGRRTRDGGYPALTREANRMSAVPRSPDSQQQRLEEQVAAWFEPKLRKRLRAEPPSHPLGGQRRSLTGTPLGPRIICVDGPTIRPATMMHREL
jgi:hypothetical protein